MSDHDGEQAAAAAARRGRPAAKRSELQAERVRAARLFLLPMMMALILVAAWPLLRTIYFSFTDTSLTNLGGGKWVGFDNYLTWRTLSSGKTVWRGTLADPAWWNAVYNTFRFAIISVVDRDRARPDGRARAQRRVRRPRASCAPPSSSPGRSRPSSRPSSGRGCFNDQFGMVNDMLMSLGIIDQKIAWTANVDTAMYAVLIVDIWKTTPFMALLCLAGLQMIPRDMYEAAKIDGIHPVKVFFKVTLPLVKPALMVAVIFRLLDALAHLRPDLRADAELQRRPRPCR